jgi:hypothetical protein
MYFGIFEIYVAPPQAEEWMKNPDMVANSIEKTFGVRVAREEIERKINLPDGDPKVQVAQRRKGGLVPPSPGPAS